MKALFTPRWIVAHVVVVIVAFVFVNLGFWQVRRLNEVRLENQIAATRYQAPPQDLVTLVSAAGPDIESLRYRRAVVEGEFIVDEEVLTRNQVYNGQAGFHVITPFAVSSGETVLVNRGWVPLPFDDPPIDAASPLPGTVVISGWLSPGQTRPPLGPEDPQGVDLEVFNRVDIPLIATEKGLDLPPVYLIADAVEGDLPLPLASPDFNDEGPHLAYAIQWFGFTLIGLIGYGALVRKELSKSG